MTNRRQPRRPYEPTGINVAGGSRKWRAMVARVVREEPICRLQYDCCTIVSTTADHIIPRKHRPDLGMVRGNLRGSCKPCNLRRGDGSRKPAPAKPRKPARALGFFG